MPTSNAALISRRAASLPGNPFAEADARAAAAVAAGKDIIDLSKGNPDGWPPSFVQDALSHAPTILPCSGTRHLMGFRNI